MKVRDVIDRLKREGWVVSRKTSGSHRVYEHPSKSGIVVVSEHGRNRDIKPGTYMSIAKQAGWK